MFHYIFLCIYTSDSVIILLNVILTHLPNIPFFDKLKVFAACISIA